MECAPARARNETKLWETAAAMKILLYGINFAPEPTGVGKYTGEMAAWLSAAGHQVRVVTAPPYYPAWKIGEGYKAWAHTRETVGGAEVWRTPVWVPAEPSGLTRVLHLLSFAIFSVPALLAQVRWKPEVVCVVAPAFVCAPGGWLVARMARARSWLHIQDFEVDAAFRMGLLRGRLAQRTVVAIERFLLRRFDRVSTISSRMMDLLRSKGIVGERAVHFPNWVDVSVITPLQRESAYRRELDIPSGSVVALYSGSMAGKQGLELLPAAAQQALHSLPNVVFVLCGDGVCKADIERECQGLPNVRLLPLQPAERLGELLGMADIQLLPQHAEAADLVMPSKLTGMLSSGRPVLATANPGTELARVVEGRGLVVPPDDLPSFMTALHRLVDSPVLRADLGQAARRYAEEHLARDRVLAAFERSLTQCIGKPLVPEKPSLRLQ
jgi:colanic acid biosynthesis glycosyl transferase WcaI